MKIRLFYKIYALTLLTVVVSITIMVSMVGYFGYHNFREYLIKSKMQELSWLADKLGEYYSEHGSFNALKEMMENPDIAQGVLPPPPPPPETNEKDGRRHSNDFEQLKKTFLTKDNKLDIYSLYHFRHFLLLLDADRNIIMGKPYSEDAFVFIPVISEHTTVGYLGLRKPPQVTHPLAAGFIRQQLSLMVLSSAAIIILTGFLSWVFTKRLLAPVPMLITATRKLASRDFAVDIRKMSNDELGELAVDFHKMASHLSMYEQKQNRWISDISHELRTPLSVLLGNIEAMQDGVRKTDADSLKILHGEVSRLIKLVNELHELTMAESDNMHFNFASASPGKITEDVVELYKSRAEEFGFQIRTMVKAGGTTVRADVSKLRQVLINIIENCLKHCKSPGIIFVACIEKEGKAAITIEDTGPCVSEEHLGKLFDRLYRSDRSRNRETGGSGLGLAICKYIIEKHDGTIIAVCGSMGGLRIEIEIPAEDRHE